MLENMNENVKLDIAIEIMSTKIANAMNSGTRKEVEQLLEERKQLYLFKRCKKGSIEYGIFC